MAIVDWHTVKTHCHNCEVRAVVLKFFYPMHPFNCFSQIKSPIGNLVYKEHFYISTLRRETKLFTIDKLNYSTF